MATDLMTALTFKIATEARELEQIRRLNYDTFVDEIPQHEQNESRVLVDPFDSENTYVVCVRGNTLLGMVAVRGRRPFSLDRKLSDLDSYLPEGRTMCEVRLLTVDRSHRTGVVFRGLLEHLIQHCGSEGYDLAVISGVVRQLKLYRHLGFVPFGPRVGSGLAVYQPMYVTREEIERRGERCILHRRRGPVGRLECSPPQSNFLPGPVDVHADVLRAAAQLAVSHRSASFVAQVKRTKQLLCTLVAAERVEVLVGSGTLANDVVAGQLAVLDAPGIVISNGEFGERLIDHATRAGLQFRVVRSPWGDVIGRDAVERELDSYPEPHWLWAAHCETSTGVLNDVVMLGEMCDARKIRVCLDCVSSVGTIPLDLSRVYLASAASGKGLGGLPGLSMVFHDHPVISAPTCLPRYLDLGLYAANEGVPFTHSSNLTAALHAAASRVSPKRYDDLAALSAWLRPRLRRLGFRILAADEVSSPAVTTIVLPHTLNSETLGARLEAEGFLLSYRSRYLLDRNWIQICLMGEATRAKIESLLYTLDRVTASPARDAPLHLS